MDTLKEIHQAVQKSQHIFQDINGVVYSVRQVNEFMLISERRPWYASEKVLIGCEVYQKSSDLN